MRILARVLLGLGVFLIIAGVLALAWAPGVVKKTGSMIASALVRSSGSSGTKSRTRSMSHRPSSIASTIEVSPTFA